LLGQWKKYVSVEGEYLEKEWKLGDSGIYLILILIFIHSFK
jgi:hypothetical protein